MPKLLKSDLPDFMSWLTHKGIRFVEGKGEFKILSITTSTGSHCLFEKPNVPDCYVITKYLAPLLREFLQYKHSDTHDKKQETPQEVQTPSPRPEQDDFREAA